MTYRTKPVATRETVAVPEWAAHLRTGDVVTVETGVAGVVEAEVIGFSKLDDYYGQPAIQTPDVVREQLAEAGRADEAPDVIALREEDLLEEELAPDGGEEVVPVYYVAFEEEADIEVEWGSDGEPRVTNRDQLKDAGQTYGEIRGVGRSTAQEWNMHVVEPGDPLWSDELEGIRAGESYRVQELDASDDSRLATDGGRDVDLNGECPACGNKTLWRGKCAHPDCEGPIPRRVAFDGGQTPSARLQTVSADLEDVAGDLREGDRYERSLASVVQQMADVSGMVGSRLEERRSEGDRFRVDDDELLTDGGTVTTGDQHLCHACGRLHDGRGAALECCSEAFDDPETEVGEGVS